MNIVINYDFFNSIRDVNEQFLGFKIIRNNSKKWVKYNLPLFTLLDMIFLKDSPNAIPLALLLEANFSFINELLMLRNYDDDYYKTNSIKRLKSLVPLFEKINVNTNYNLLLESKCCFKVTNLKLNDNKLPILIESKYILVPSFDYRGSLNDTSILQEHVLGSDIYTLSRGNPVKSLKLVSKKA